MKLYRSFTLVLIFFSLESCTSFKEWRMTEEEAFEDFSKSGIRYRDISLQDQRQDTIHSVAVGCDDNSPKDILVFVHGSPGNWIHYWSYLKDSELLQRYCMIGIDRPGFGRSGNPLPDINLQAKRIIDSLSLLRIPRPKKKYILVGHSYGGPVAARIASLKENKITHLVLLAAALDPEKEELKWYNRLADTKIARLLLPSPWIVSNEEMIPMKDQLKEIEADWKMIRSATYIVQGGKDTLVDPANLEFVRRLFPKGSVKEEIFLPDGDHFLPWNSFPLIKRILLDIAQE
ncbi:alpha/beta fold hydrolase [Leptospira broomii]|nr:alpha/beta fold hydrolase [Leptospira broomii]